MAFELPALPFAYDALAPHMSKETLEYHHDKHHKTYVETANKLLQDSGLEGKSLEDVIIASHRNEKLKKLYNNAAQHWNHSQFWLSLKQDSDMPKGALAKAIDSTFGGLEAFKKNFVAEGVAQFGSGWVWLAADHGKLEILKTGNADNPLIVGKTALLVCDVWEHAYYIDYRNAREKYLQTFADHLANWAHATEMFDQAASHKAAA
jgi:superoxide dismutase, Fe-Mn family